MRVPATRAEEILWRRRERRLRIFGRIVRGRRERTVERGGWSVEGGAWSEKSGGPNAPRFTRHAPRFSKEWARKIFLTVTLRKSDRL